jgi:DNA-binding response OmpR family regulator
MDEKDKVISQLRVRVSELEMHVEELKFHINEIETGATNYADWPFRLTLGENTLLGFFMAKKDTVITRLQAFQFLYGLRHEDKQPDPKILDVWLVKLRRKLKPYGVAFETIWGVGWRLPLSSYSRLIQLRQFSPGTTPEDVNKWLAPPAAA